MAGTVPTGTWSGRSGFIGEPLQQERLSTIRLTLTAQTAAVLAVGPTGASHDSPTAKATCTSRYRFEAVQDGWRYYKQTAGTLKGEGGLETGPCSPRPELVMRVRPAGAKLKAEWGTRPQHAAPRSRDRFLHVAYLVRG